MNSRHPLVVILFGAFMVYILYYLMSPYQACLRNSELFDDEITLKSYCRNVSGW